MSYQYICILLGVQIFLIHRRLAMETRVAVMGIIVENPDSASYLNSLLHEYGSYLI